MTIQIYCDPCTINSRKVLAGLDQINADYKQNYINFFTGGHKSDKFKKINPCATVPAATDGDLVLTESNAILQYAADVTPGGDSVYPKDLKQRALVNRWLLWEASVWFQTCYTHVVENIVKPGFYEQEPDRKVLEDESERFHKSAGLLDDQLGKTKWLAGDHVTIADFAVAAPMHLYEASKLPLDKYPNLTRWMKEGMEQLPSWRDTQEAVDAALLPNKGKEANGAKKANGASDAATRQ